MYGRLRVSHALARLLSIVSLSSRTVVTIAPACKESKRSTCIRTVSTAPEVTNFGPTGIARLRQVP